jgi:hypothetical protein
VARACGLPAAPSAGQPLARLGAVPGGGAARPGRAAWGMWADPSTVWRGGRWKSRLIFLYSPPTARLLDIGGQPAPRAETPG